MNMINIRTKYGFDIHVFLVVMVDKDDTRWTIDDGQRQHQGYGICWSKPRYTLHY